MGTNTRRNRCAGGLVGLSIAISLSACGAGSDEPAVLGDGRQAPSEAPQAPLNVVLITMDTTRADGLGCYGQPLPSSPQIDRLAADGVRFEQVVTSSPSTLPSHASILTGKQPYAHGARSNAGYVLADGNVTLAEILAAEGHRTGAEIATQVIASHTKLDQGFHHYRDPLSFDVQRKAVTPVGESGPERIELPERPAEEITRRGIEFLRSHRDRRFFLWLHYFDPHRILAPPKLFRDRIPASPYHAEILYADYHIGRVASELTRLGLRDRTLLVLTGDHGEGMGQHGEETHTYFVYDSTMRVPLILWGAKLLPRGQVISTLVRTVDIAPTVLDLLGLPPRQDVQGVSLRPLLEGDTADLKLTGYGESIESLATFGTAILRFVREGNWKYIHKVDPELYDVRADPDELSNLASRHPEVVERLRSRLKELIASAPDRPQGAEVATDGEMLAQLAALGYVGASTAPEIEDELAALELTGDDPVSKAEAMRLFAKAHGHMVARQYERAEQILRPLWEAHPDSAPLIHGLVEVLNQLERYDEAIPLLRRAIELDPGFQNFYLLLATMTEKKGEVSEAEALLRTAMDMDACGIKPRIRLANLMASETRYAEQLAILDAGIEQCSGSTATAFRNDYAYVLASCPDERFRDGPRALEIAQQVVAEGKGAHPTYLDTLAAAYAEVGQFEKAVETSRKAIALLQNRDMPEEAVASFRNNLEHYEAGRPVRQH
jgi:arylsulfatase A-like enzyme/Flp pilus assembly protein TadD